MKMPVDVLFYVFASMTCLPLVYLVFTKNIIIAAFAFTISLLGMAALYVLLNADFMAVVQILIYAGGIVVLLIFGVMLTKRTSKAGVFTSHHQLISGLLIFVGMIAFLISSIVKSNPVWNDTGVASQNQIKQVGILYLTDHLVAFELIAFLLLAALVAAAFLAKKSES
ncbi:MAG: NADH-quinone oxidoreductase subunit J [Cyclobacteriaceae bacterium]